MMTNGAKQAEHGDVGEATLDPRDRRRNYRIEAQENENPVAAEIENENGEMVTVEVINYSASGLLCYGPHDWQVQVDAALPRIRLQFARKPDLVLRGEVVRVQKNHQRTFCGIRFVKEEPAHRSRKVRAAALTDDIRLRWMEKVRNLPNYFQADSVEEQIAAEREAYAAFEDLARNFSVEERWWFFEMLDELKRREPLYPARLVEEFALVCEYGYSGIPARPDWQAGKRGLLQSFWLALKLFFRRWFKK